MSVFRAPTLVGANDPKHKGKQGLHDKLQVLLDFEDERKTPASNGSSPSIKSGASNRDNSGVFEHHKSSPG